MTRDMVDAILVNVRTWLYNDKDKRGIRVKIIGSNKTTSNAIFRDFRKTLRKMHTECGEMMSLEWNLTDTYINERVLKLHLEDLAHYVTHTRVSGKWQEIQAARKDPTASLWLDFCYVVLFRHEAQDFCAMRLEKAEHNARRFPNISNNIGMWTIRLELFQGYNGILDGLYGDLPSCLEDHFHGLMLSGGGKKKLLDDLENVCDQPDMRDYDPFPKAPIKTVSLTTEDVSYKGPQTRSVTLTYCKRPRPSERISNARWMIHHQPLRRPRPSLSLSPWWKLLPPQSSLRKYLLPPLLESRRDPDLHIRNMSGVCVERIGEL